MVKHDPRAASPAHRGTLTLLGPAFVAAVAYVDPGNFATNFSGGASFGYLLLWVIVTANLMAMLIQTLTAKLGLATGRDLASLCRERFPRPVTWGLWLQAEAVAIATDIAEIVGGAVALNLLFGVPLPVGGLISASSPSPCSPPRPAATGRSSWSSVDCWPSSRLGFGYTLIRSGADPARDGRRHGAEVRGHRQRAAGHRDPGCDGDAARDLRALRAGPGPLPAAAGRRPARPPAPRRRSCCAPSGSTSSSRWGSPGWSTR